mgnify:CR=1 FL=1
MQVLDQFGEPGRLEFMFETAALRQCVQREMVVEQRLQTFLDGDEILRFQIAALHGGGQYGVQRRQVAGQLLLRGDDVVEFVRQHRPPAVRHEHAPLRGLLGHDLQRIVQVLDLCATRSRLWRPDYGGGRSQNPIVVPSALRSALDLLDSIIASMSRSKISGWNTSSTRRRFFSTCT